MLFDNILKALGVIAPLIGGLYAALKGTAAARRKRMDTALAAERTALKDKESELDARDAKAMKELTDKVEKLGSALDEERKQRELQSAEFFRILQTFRNREWRLSEHVHVLETLLKAKEILFEPLAADLRELPNEISQFFRRSTDPQPPPDHTR